MHLAGCVPAFFLPDRSTALWFTVLLIPFMVSIFPHLPVARDVRRHPIDFGYISTPVALFLAFLLFPFPVALTSWVVLSVADASSSFSGILWKGKGFSWNAQKNWGGFLGFFVSAFVSSAGFYLFYLPAFHSVPPSNGVGAIRLPHSTFLLPFLFASFTSGVVESVCPEGWDNLPIVISFCITLSAFLS